MKAKDRTIEVKGAKIRVMRMNSQDYISLTDMMKSRDGEFHILNWLRNRNTVEFLGIWEKVNNPDFNPVEFDRIRTQAGLNSFRLTAKDWINGTGAIGLISAAGRYGGTYAHVDIAFEFGMWISAEFKVYLIKEFHRLKQKENKRLNSQWNLSRELSKINYRIHTDAIKEHLVPSELNRFQKSAVYANEADLLNVALFGMTAKEWKENNQNAKGNIRDDASIEQLIVLSNLESLNAVLIDCGVAQSERLVQLNKAAITQMKSLLNYNKLDEMRNELRVEEEQAEYARQDDNARLGIAS